MVVAIPASGRTPTPAPHRRRGRSSALIVGIANEDPRRCSTMSISPFRSLPGRGRCRIDKAEGRNGLKVCLNMISTLVMTQLGYVRDGQMVAMKPSNASTGVTPPFAATGHPDSVRADAAWRGSALQ